MTVCTHERQPLFGHVSEGQMLANSAGMMINQAIQGVSARFPDCDVDTWIVMPDHVHLIVHCGVNPETNHAATVGEVIRWFKSTTVEAWRIGVRDNGWPRYNHHLWQPNYFDRIIRNDRQLQVERAYIAGNPGRWWERHGDGS